MLLDVSYSFWRRSNNTWIEISNDFHTCKKWFLLKKSIFCVIFDSFLLQVWILRYDYAAFVCLHLKSKWQFILKVLCICWNLPKLKMSWWYISKFYYRICDFENKYSKYMSMFRFCMRITFCTELYFILLLMSIFNKKLFVIEVW